MEHYSNFWTFEIASLPNVPGHSLRKYVRQLFHDLKFQSLILAVKVVCHCDQQFNRKVRYHYYMHSHLCKFLFLLLYCILGGQFYCLVKLKMVQLFFKENNLVFWQGTENDRQYTVPLGDWLEKKKVPAIIIKQQFGFPMSTT